MVDKITMLKPERLAEIEKVYQNSRYGYDTRQPSFYAGCIGDLLDERKELLDKIAELEAAAAKKPKRTPRGPK